MKEYGFLVHMNLPRTASLCVSCAFPNPASRCTPCGRYFPSYGAFGSGDDKGNCRLWDLRADGPLMEYSLMDDRGGVTSVCGIFSVPLKNIHSFLKAMLGM